MKTLLIIIAVFFAFGILSKIFLRYFFPRLLQWYVRRMFRVPGEETKRSQDTIFKSAKDKPEGPGGRDDEGEYIDFEEIKDK